MSGKLSLRISEQLVPVVSLFTRVSPLATGTRAFICRLVLHTLTGNAMHGDQATFSFLQLDDLTPL